MKKFYLFAICILVINIGIYAQRKYAEKSSSSRSIVTIETIETLSIIEEIDDIIHGECLSGGPGALSCSISGGINTDFGVSFGCSVTCKDTEYACCGFGCKCKKINED